MPRGGHLVAGVDGEAAAQLARLDRATATLDPPFALVDLDAFDANAQDLVRRAGGRQIRLATKSLRCRALQDRALAAHPSVRGILAFTLPEALWLAGHGAGDLLVAYPTTDRAALRDLAALLAERPGLRLALMVDSAAQLDLIDAATGPRVQPVQVCLELDAGWRPHRRLHVGPKRSPLHTPAQAAAFARHVVGREGFELVGVMSYEGQIAGVGNAPPGRRAMGLAVRAMQAASGRELARRRAAAVAAVQAVAPLRFVNGGGTGSLERTVREPAVTEVAAGSGLYGPWLFDSYRHFRPRPAALFALPVVRKPAAEIATLLGGGYLASGAADASRLPQPYLPAGLRLDALEGAGEVQTPVLGAAAAALQVGDRVYLRHAKAGELCERFDRLHLIASGRIVDEVPTYRGEGRTFL
jgi:D-serine deaminase-like pyridoxal phosphate-dependent protein